MRRSLARLLRSPRGSRDDERPPAAPPTLVKWSRDSKLRHLSAIDIFQDLEPADLDWVAAHTTMVTAQPGQLVYTPGETSEALFLLKTGRVQIYRLSADGKKVVLSTLNSDTFFGDMPLTGQHMYGAFAEAIEGCTLCVLGRADLERLIESKPRVAIRVLEVVGRRLVEAEAAIEDLAFKSISARLATLLLRLSAAKQSRELVGYTHQDLAEMVGTYRETATLTLDDFKRRGLVELGRKQIRIVDHVGLEALAES